MLIEEKLSKLTTIPTNNFDNMFRLMSEIFCDEILNSIECGESVACVDIGFGKLSFLIEDDGISYKFVPDNKFEDMIIKAVKSKNSPLIDHINRGITEKIMEAYKNLM